MTGTSRISPSTTSPDFSLVLGGPLFELFRRARLSGDHLELLRRRVLALSAVAWLPLLLLSGLALRAPGPTGGLRFLQDVEAHVRFLVALPVLIAAEVIVHSRLRNAAAQFVHRRMVRPDDLPSFHQAVVSTLRLRNSVSAEAALLLLVCTVGVWLSTNQVALGPATWYARPDSGGTHLTPAGFWYVFVSVPLFQFILLRWYWRMLLWFRFLWRVSRLDLRLLPLHPDRAAGLGFLGASTTAFVPLLLAQGALTAALIASQILYVGRQPMSFKVQVAAVLAFVIAVILVPLTVFTPSLARARRRGLADFGGLVSRQVGEFEERWMPAGAPPPESLPEAGEIQQLAELGNRFAVIQEMRLVPFGLKDVTWLVAAAAAPLLPLVLTVYSLEELVDHLVKVLF